MCVFGLQKHSRVYRGHCSLPYVQSMALHRRRCQKTVRRKNEMDTESLKTDGHRFESCSVRLPKTLKGTRGWSPGSFSYLPVLLASSAGPMQDHVQFPLIGNNSDSLLFHIEVSDSSLSPAAIGIRFISVFLYSDLPASAVSVRIHHSKGIVRDF